MIFKPFPGYVHIKRMEPKLPPSSDEGIWVPPANEKQIGVFIMVELISAHPRSDLLILRRPKKRIVVDSRMIETCEVDGKVIEFIAEQYVVGQIDE